MLKLEDVALWALIEGRLQHDDLAATRRLSQWLEHGSDIASKYIGTQVSWDSPAKTATEDCSSKAQAAHMKLQQLWRSNLGTRAKGKIFHFTVVPALIYSLDTLTLEIHHFKTIDAWYHKFL